MPDLLGCVDLLLETEDAVVVQDFKPISNLPGLLSWTAANPKKLSCFSSV